MWQKVKIPSRTWYTDQAESYVKSCHRTGVSTRTANPESQDCDFCIYITWPKLRPAEKPQMYHHLLCSLHLSGGEQEQEQEQEENGKNNIFSLTLSLSARQRKKQIPAPDHTVQYKHRLLRSGTQSREWRYPATGYQHPTHQHQVGRMKSMLPIKPESLRRFGAAPKLEHHFVHHQCTKKML